MLYLFHISKLKTLVKLFLIDYSTCPMTQECMPPVQCKFLVYNVTLGPIHMEVGTPGSPSHPVHWGIQGGSEFVYHGTQ